MYSWGAQRGMEQWVGEEELHYITEAKAEAIKKASIDVDARAQELYLEFVRAEMGGGSDGEGPDTLARPAPSPAQAGVVGGSTMEVDGVAGEDETGAEWRGPLDKEELLRRSEGRVPQAQACWDMCYQVALRENAQAQAAGLEELRVRRLRFDPDEDEAEDSGYPEVEDEFASDTSNSTDMWERRDARGRRLPAGIRRLRPFPLLSQDTLENNPQILAQLLAGPAGGPAEVPDYKEWELLSRHDVWLPRRRQQERARTLLADCQVHLDVALKHADAREADAWRRVMYDIEVEAGLKGPNAPTEEELRDEAAQRAIHRLFDMERQGDDLQRYEDFKTEHLLDASEEEEGGREGSDAEEDEEGEDEEDEAIDEVLDVGQERRAAVMASAKIMLEKAGEGEEAEADVAGSPGQGQVETYELNPSLGAKDFMGKQTDAFLLQHARDEALLLKQASAAGDHLNGLYEDWESFSDTDRILQHKGRKLPAGTERTPEGGVVVQDWSAPSHLTYTLCFEPSTARQRPPAPCEQPPPAPSPHSPHLPHPTPVALTPSP